jgi:hypothetical protein
MVTFLITSVLLLGLVAIAIYFWQKPANQTQTIELPPPERGRGLFAEVVAEPEPLELPPAPVPETIPETLPNETKAQAEALIESFPTSPNRNSVVRMLHAAALSDDAALYQHAVEAALRAWREQELKEISASDLEALFTSEFWVLSSGTRSSGAGFVLKRTLASARRELVGPDPNGSN